MVSNVDFAPTLLDFAGVVPPSGIMDGISFRPALDGGPWRDPDALYFELGFTRGVRMGEWKYIALCYPERPERLVDARKTDEYGPIRPIIRQKALPPVPPYGHIAGNNNEFKTLKEQPAYFDRDQLYNLRLDPHEQTNLAMRVEFADTLAQLRHRLSRFLAELPDGFQDLIPTVASDRGDDGP